MCDELRRCWIPYGTGTVPPRCSPAVPVPAVTPKAMPAAVPMFLEWLPATLHNDRGLMLAAGAGVVLLAGVVFAILAMKHVI